jgi:hypothetical protein
MAADYEVINGTDVMVFLSPSTGGTTWKSVAHANSHSLSIKMSTRETSNKGSGDKVTRGAGRLDITGSIEGMYIDSDKYNLEDFMEAIITREPYMMFFGKEASTGVADTTTSGGAHFYASGNFYITSVDATFPDQANSTYTVSIEHANGFDLNKLYVS